MPCKKQLDSLIPKIYKYNAESLGLFFSVKTQKHIFPTISIEQAIKNYFKIADISVDDWDLMGAAVTYNRMEHDFYDSKRNESTSKD